MSEDAPAPVAVEPPLPSEPDVWASRPPKPGPGYYWDVEKSAWKHRTVKKRRINERVFDETTGTWRPLTKEIKRLKETDIVINNGVNRKLKRFDIRDFRERMREKTEDAVELCLDELRDRLSSASKVSHIPTSVLRKTLEYLDTRNAEVKRRELEEGVAKNAATVENHAHLAIFQFPPKVWDAMPTEAQEFIEAQRIKAIETASG